MGKFIVQLFAVFIVILAGFLAAQVYTTFAARAHIQNIPDGYHFGPDDADLTVVEFLDYSCPYCQEVHPTIMNAVEQDGNVRYAPLPIRSGNADGSSAAYILYAAGKMGAFQRAHNYLMENGTNLTKERIPEIAADLDLDADQFADHLASKDVYDQVIDNHEAMRNLGNGATPTFYLGPDIRYIPQDRLPTVEEFLTMFEEARASQ